jgi:tRNA pseudouridine13 synthase
MSEAKAVPESDAAVGMTVYLTSSPGIGGRIRQRVEDFVVNEVYASQVASEGRFQLVKVTKTDTETHHMARELSRRLQISQRRISWAGTKDKRAVTTQRVSVDSIRLAEALSFGNVVAEPIGRSDRPITLGDLDGNDFVITVRAVAAPQNNVTSAVKGMIEETRKARGLPNFFGIQRFGSIRPVNHLVGRALVDGDVERAVMTYIGKPFPDEPDDVKAVRQSVAETYDFKEALKRLPIRLRYERAMLNHLAKYPNDFDGALAVLSTNLQKLFVHAFQSYLFNRMVSSRLERGFPLAVGFDGDRVWALDRERLRTVVPKNVQEVNQSLAAGTAYVQMPVPGYDTELSDGVIGQIEREVLASAGIDLDAFRVEGCPRLAAKGVMRNTLLPADIRFDIAADELAGDRLKVELRFFLPKGGYATTVLREIMKTRLA